jgi:hypothetical protein
LLIPAQDRTTGVALIQHGLHSLNLNCAGAFAQKEPAFFIKSFRHDARCTLDLCARRFVPQPDLNAGTGGVID